MARRLRWGVMGTANIAQIAVIPAIHQSTSGAVEALASRDIEKARSVARSLGIGRVVGSYEALLEDADVEAVYIPIRTLCMLNGPFARPQQARPCSVKNPWQPPPMMPNGRSRHVLSGA
jgi:hypothetical protein